MKKFSTLLLAVAFVKFSFGQATLPSAYNISSTPYTLNGWDSLAAAGSAPPNMKFHFTIEAESASGDHYDSSAEGSRDYDCKFNLTSRNRILGLGAKGFAFQATSSAQYNDCAGTVTTADANRYVGAAVLAINTTSKTNVGVKWTGTVLVLGDGNGDTTVRRQFATRLQYRVGSTGNYSDVIVNSLPVQFDSKNKAAGQSGVISATLPAACNNQALVFVRWVYFQVQVGSGTRPEISIDDIQVGSNILPINLLSFDAVLNNNSVSLAWKTSNEISFKQFNVEKSIDGTAFNTIGAVAGKNIAGTNSYSFADDKLITGNSFYRLKMIDADGKYSYSGVIKVFSKNTNSLLIYPNPVKDNLTLMHTQATSNATIKIVSYTGKTVAAYSVQPNAIQSSFNISTLPSGSYMLLYNDGNKLQTTKFVKQ